MISGEACGFTPKIFKTFFEITFEIVFDNVELKNKNTRTLLRQTTQCFNKFLINDRKQQPRNRPESILSEAGLMFFCQIVAKHARASLHITRRAPIAVFST